MITQFTNNKEYFANAPCIISKVSNLLMMKFPAIIKLTPKINIIESITVRTIAVLRFCHPLRLSVINDALLKFLIKAINPFDEKNNAATKPKDNNPPFLFLIMSVKVDCTAS